jgi:hypothetical protein
MTTYLTQRPHGRKGARVRYLRSLGFRRRRKWLRPFVVRVYGVEHLELGGTA